jgi:hypothetical protein
MSIKRFAGTSGSVSLPAGAEILRLDVFGGTATLPDGVGGNVTVTAPSSGWFYAKRDVQIPAMMIANPGFTIIFGGTTGYFIEVSSPGGF